MRKYIVGIVIGVLLSSAVVVLAGNLDPPSGPTDAASQMHCLEDIYNRLNDGTARKKMTSFTEPASGPGTRTMHTLDDIMGIAPAADDTNGAAPADVLTGKTFWGLRTGGTWGPQTGTATHLPAPVPKTGQTDCYLSADPWGTCTCGKDQDCPIGQDGDLEEGVAWPSPRFTDNLDGTVTDDLTGLIWLKNANCFGASTWKWAFNHADTLSHLDCGLTDGSNEGDWRLPNVRELFSLIDHSQYNPALPSGVATVFTGVQSGHYWSSTTNAHDTSGAWYVKLSNGNVNVVDKTGSNYVWPVRGGQ
jgi:hypothetical protein